METSTFVLIELFGFFGLVLAIGFWELYTLRRDRKRLQRRGAEPGAKANGGR